MIKEFKFKSDSIIVTGRRWYDPENPPKAVVQIVHGMAETIDRYDEFARYLVSEGFVVYGHDHRGHGKTAGKIDKVGHFSDSDGWSKVVNDVYEVTNKIKLDYPAVPIFIFGHSMGSYITRNYIIQYSDKISGTILSGSGFFNNSELSLGKSLSKLFCDIKGVKYKSRFLSSLAFFKFNSKIKNNETEFDWLSRDKHQVKKYIENPFCGQICTAKFYYDLFSGIEGAQDETAIYKIARDFPMFFISGDMDPAGKYGKGVKKAVEFYQADGLEDVSYKLYEGARHELTNEINRQVVYEDVVTWIKNKLKDTDIDQIIM